MKRIVAFLLILFNANFAFGYITENMTGGCNNATVGYDMYAVFTLSTYTCSAGYYLPANYDGCVACPTGATCSGGTFDFNTSIAQGITYNMPVTNNISRGCNNNLVGANGLKAIFTINSYTCNPGYYVPANNDGCVICPADSYCAGGTYSFNKTTTQGITACPDNKTSPAGSDAESDCAYVSMCATGEYLPMNTTTCTICPADSYCPGGTYIFNETTAQGITVCSAGLYSPTGAASAAQCGRILHIGDDIMYLRSDKITSPALHIDVDHDGVADFFGNMTTADVVMHAGSEHKFKVKYGDTIYSVYDDTVTVP